MAMLSIYVPDHLATTLKTRADEDGRSLSNFVTLHLARAMRTDFDTSTPAVVREARETTQRLKENATTPAVVREARETLQRLKEKAIKSAADRAEARAHTQAPKSSKK